MMNIFLLEIEEIKQKYQMIQDLDEIVQLFNEVKKIKPKSILEIGIERGGTFKLWEQLILSNYPSGYLCGIDTNINNILWGWGKSSLEIDVIKGRSQDVYSLVVGFLTEVREFDFIFIDGDHSYEGVKSDYNLYSTLIRKGGLIG